MALNRKPSNPVKVTNLLGYNNGITVVDMVSKSPDYSFTAFLTQVSNEAPKMHVLYDDTLPEHTFVSTYESSGVYRLHSVIINPRNTKVEINNAQGSAYPCLITAKVHDGYIEINSYDSALSLMDDTLMDTPIKVEVWLNGNVDSYVPPVPTYPLACYEGTYVNFGYAYYVTEVVINGNTVAIPLGMVAEYDSISLLGYLHSTGYPDIQDIFYAQLPPSYNPFIQFKDSSYLITSMTLDDGVGNVLTVAINTSAYCLPVQSCFSTEAFELSLYENPTLTGISVNGTNYPCSIAALPQYSFEATLASFLQTLFPPDLYNQAYVQFVQVEPGKFRCKIGDVDFPNVIDGMTFSDDLGNEFFVPVSTDCPFLFNIAPPANGTNVFVLSFSGPSELSADYFDPTTAVLQDWNNLLGTSFTELYTQWAFDPTFSGYKVELWGHVSSFYGYQIVLDTFFQGYTTLRSVFDGAGWVKEVVPMAFMNNGGLINVSLPALSVLGESAFENVSIGNFNASYAITLIGSPSNPVILDKNTFKNISTTVSGNIQITINTNGAPLIVREGVFYNSDVDYIQISQYVISIGDNVFNGCTNLASFNVNFSNVVSLGSTAGDDNVFTGITGLPTNTIAFKNTLQTNNGGLPDGDIQTLIANNPLITIVYV